MIVLVILMLAILAWGLITSSNVSITINGQELSGPLKTVTGAWGLILATVIFFCVAILLTFVFMGVWLIVIGCLALVGIILAVVAFPFLLPLLIPLFILWAFCAWARKGKAVKA